jgi:hypothetical protein
VDLKLGAGTLSAMDVLLFTEEAMVSEEGCLGVRVAAGGGWNIVVASV